MYIVLRSIFLTRPRRWYIFWNDGMSMVFHMSTIGINGFSNGFSIRDNGYSMFFLPLDHWYQWFVQWFFHKRRCFFNGFLALDHWYRWFFQWFFHYRRWWFNGFLPLDHWYRWFFTVEPLVSMVFPMVSYSGNIYESYFQLMIHLK